MKSRRIFAAVMASVCAVSATAVAASAAPTVTNDGTALPKVVVDESGSIGNISMTAKSYGLNADYTKIDKIEVSAKSTDYFKFKVWAKVGEKWGWIEATDDTESSDGKEATAVLDGIIAAGGLSGEGTLADGAFGFKSDWVNAGTFEITKVVLYDKDGKVLSQSPAAAEPDDPAGKDDDKTDPGDSDKNDDDKPSTDPGDSDKNENKPGASDKETITNDVVVDKVLKGADLTKAIFGDSKKEWKDVESVTFESDEPFAVVFNVKEGKIKDDAKATKFIKGVTELAKDEDLPAKAFATKWTLSADEVAAMLEADAKADSLQLISKDGKKITVKATVTTKAASKPDDNKNTGIALVVAPVVLAGAAVAVAAISKKRK